MEMQACAVERLLDRVAVEQIFVEANGMLERALVMDLDPKAENRGHAVLRQTAYERELGALAAAEIHEARVLQMRCDLFDAQCFGVFRPDTMK